MSFQDLTRQQLIETLKMAYRVIDRQEQLIREQKDKLEVKQNNSYRTGYKNGWSRAMQLAGNPDADFNFDSIVEFVRARQN